MKRIPRETGPPPPPGVRGENGAGSHHPPPPIGLNLMDPCCRLSSHTLGDALAGGGICIQGGNFTTLGIIAKKGLFCSSLLRICVPKIPLA